MRSTFSLVLPEHPPYEFFNRIRLLLTFRQVVSMAVHGRRQQDAIGQRDPRAARAKAFAR